MMINNDYISLYPSEGTPAGLCQKNENNNVKFIKNLIISNSINPGINLLSMKGGQTFWVGLLNYVSSCW